MTPTEIESYKTWATNKGTKEGFAVVTSTGLADVFTSVIKRCSGNRQASATFETPHSKPRAEAEEAFIAACRKVDARIKKLDTPKHP